MLTITCPRAALEDELHDCQPFRGEGDLERLFAAEYSALATHPDSERGWHLWARRVHLRWHADTRTQCPLQQQVLAQLDPDRFPQYFTPTGH